ncbi:MAG: MCE family protein [Deltaproteobacteria bacterium]|nr:MCE family protein [Deltaproteobacteria bacterium]
MATPESHKTETMVGIFVLLGIAAVSVLVFSIAGKQKLFEPRYRLRAEFSEIGGLKIGAPVRLAGLEVGNVESLKFTPGGKIVATLSLRKRYRYQIRSDSVATISSVGILGDKSVEITIGSKIKGILRDGMEIQAKNPFDVAQFIDQVIPMAEKLDKILSYISSISGEFAMQDLHLSETMEHAGNIVKKIDEGRGSFGKAVNDPALYDKLIRLSNSARTAADEVKKTALKIDRASGQLPAIFTSTRKTMENLSAVTGDVRAGTKHLPRIAAEADETVRNLHAASRELPAIAGSFRNAAQGAEDVVEAAKRSWLIRRNLPRRTGTEERILLGNRPISYEESRP